MGYSSALENIEGVPNTPPIILLPGGVPHVYGRLNPA
jgi:hypothetical protein